MGLEFTEIPDRAGPAVYLLGNTMIEDRLRPLGEAVDKLTPDETQVVYLDIDTGDGAKVAEFYAFSRESLPVIMIVQDDDTIHRSWQGQDLPAADVIAYELNQLTGLS